MPVSLLEVTPKGRTIDAVFKAFDGNDYLIDGRSYRVNVYGVFDDGHYKWVQLAVCGARRSLVTLCFGTAGKAAMISSVA
jgi:hypothetical protein